MGRIGVVRGMGFACMATMLVALAFAGPAHAAFPGANGKIAFQSSQAGNYEVFIVDSAGAGLSQLTTSSGRRPCRSWSSAARGPRRRSRR